jgi:hypothetical protein
MSAQPEMIDRISVIVGDVFHRPVSVEFVEASVLFESGPLVVLEGEETSMRDTFDSVARWHTCFVERSAPRLLKKNPGR